MNDNNAVMIPDGKTNPLDQLQNLLEMQIKLFSRCGISPPRQIEQLTEQTNKLVEEITRAGILQLAKFKDRREHLQKLYHQLCLAIAAQKADTTEKLNQVRKCKKTITVYRSNI